MVEIQYDIFLQRKEEKSRKREKKNYTLRNLKFSSNKICLEHRHQIHLSRIIRQILLKDSAKVNLMTSAPTNFVR